MGQSFLTSRANEVLDLIRSASNYQFIYFTTTGSSKNIITLNFQPTFIVGVICGSGTPVDVFMVYDAVRGTGSFSAYGCTGYSNDTATVIRIGSLEINSNRQLILNEGINSSASFNGAAILI